MTMRCSLWLAAAVTAVFSVHAAQAASNKTLGSVATTNAHDAIVVNGYAYVADDSAGITVVNVGTSSAPAVVGSYDTPGTALNVDVSGTVLYVADSSSVQILSIATPTSPQLLGTYSESGFVINDVVADGTHLYVLGLLNGTPTLEAINAANSAAPVPVGAVAVSAATSMTISGDYAYVVGGTTLNAVTISTYPSMSVSGTFTDALGSTTFAGVQVFGSTAYMNDPVNGLHAVSISTPSAMSETYNSGAGSTYGSGVAISNGYVFLPLYAGGLNIFDIASTGTPIFVDALVGTATSQAVTIANDVAVMSNGTAGIQLLDVSHPDEVAPLVTPNGGTGDGGTIVVTPGGTFTDPGVTATDNIGGAVPTAWTTVSGTVNTTKVGRYVLTYTTTDRAGNTTSIQRVVYVAPSISSVKTSRNKLRIKVGKKFVTMVPFPGYYGAIVAKKVVLDTTKNPYYMFISTATKYPKMVVYDANGKVKWRTDYRDVSANGLLVQLAPNPVSSSVYIALAPNSGAMKVSIYNLAKTGVKKLKTFTAKGGRGTLVMAFLKISTTEYALVTKQKNTSGTPYVWRYKGGKTSWYRDTTFPAARLWFGKTYIKLRY